MNAAELPHRGSTSELGADISFGSEKKGPALKYNKYCVPSTAGKRGESGGNMLYK